MSKQQTMSLAQIFKDRLQTRRVNDRSDAGQVLDYVSERFPAYTMSIIAMELMEGFTTFHEASQENKIIPMHYHMVNYAFKQVHDLGYIHGDAHTGNIMINPDMMHFTQGDQTYLGRVIVIDFGYTRPITAPEQRLSDGDKLNLEIYYARDQRWSSHKFNKDINYTLIGRRKSFVDEVLIPRITPQIESFMAQLGLPLPYNLYTFIYNVILRNPDRYYLLGGKIDNTLALLKDKNKFESVEKSGKTIQQKSMKTMTLQNYDTIAKQFKTMSFGEIENIILRQLE